MTGNNRRMGDKSVTKAAKRHKVNPHVTHNRKLEKDMRLENIEHDVVFNTQILYEVLETNQRYSVFLEAKIKSEEASAEFWADIRKRLVSASIIGVVSIVGAALWFAFKAYVDKL